jgi:hypothetical protein
LHGEVKAAQEAGHAPALLHAHYRGLATRREALKWFGVKPARGENIVEFQPKQEAL